MIDQEVICIGSANFNKKTTKDMQECNILVRNKNSNFSKRVLSELKKDMKSSFSKKIHNPDELDYSSIMAFLEGCI